ncbi:MAG: PAS domain S-box protein [Bacteroidetes bacterium]|nr:PAS domain S-box protein [Bacteroidota bacterium]
MNNRYSADNGKFEALFQHASMGILVSDDNGEIVIANNFLLQQFGYNTESELQGKSVEILIPKRYHHNHVNYRNQYSVHPKPRAMGIGKELFGKKKDGTEFPVEVSLGHYKNKTGNYTIAFIIDITERKKIEQNVIDQRRELSKTNQKIEELNNSLEKKVELRTSQLRKLMEQIEASRDKLSDALSKEKELSDLKSRFVSMASHEFRTPLSTILSSVSLLAKYTEKEEQDKRDKHILRIKSSVNNLTGLLNEFLSIGKIEDGKIIANFSTFNIKELCEGICTEMQSLVMNGQKINYSHSGAEDVVLDMSLLRNIIFNLLSNAIKFSNKNGKIEVSTIVDKKVTLIIKDNGIGISKDDQKHLFERFFRAKNATNIQGTGLGLHIVEKYVELMKGKLQWSSELGEGTEFKITFKK